MFVDHRTELMDRVEMTEQPSSKQMYGRRGGERLHLFLLLLFVSAGVEVYTCQIYANGCAAGPNPFRNFQQLSRGFPQLVTFAKPLKYISKVKIVS